MKTYLMSIYTIIMIGISVLMLSGCSSAPKVVGSYTQEDIDAKSLTPAQGNALIYFFYGRGYGWGNVEVSLDGASSLINEQMYVVWEVPAGKHTLAMIMPGQNTLSLKIAKKSLNAPAGSIQFYRAVSYKKEESDTVSELLYQLIPASDSDGKEFVRAYSLVSWFRDGERIYYNDTLLNRAE
ncbi:hypothetical protein U14_02050 [Candidatus Moduliflexus flocculans]|uniref:DUF2846 domain-containing protein n=1 Tax=Candidatus Moduliflexus flocculans TaxID=1499966 RepID=A0A0S6VY55_9BACT|nr:hypothetical protein U14_02050 [Candidatus Moduliflexus flocculans]